MRLREAISVAAARLMSSSETPRLDAEVLAAHALGISREKLLLSCFDESVPECFGALVDRRAAREPISYITGTRDFWTLSLEVAPGVLIPRPDSETLIETARSHFSERAPEAILDLGTGSGALLLAALSEWPSARGVGVDYSEQAIRIARANATRLAIADRVEIRAGDWGQGIAAQFDLILCNPPYIRSGERLPADVAGYEPASALFAGQDGLDAYRALAPDIGRLMRVEGIAVFEIGWDQAAAVSDIFASAGFAPRITRDLAGCDRCVVINSLATGTL